MGKVHGDQGFAPVAFDGSTARLWGGGPVEVQGTALGVFIEFTRKVRRGSATFQLAFDVDSLDDLSEAVTASKSAVSQTHAL